jgi:hypothetical protein
MAAALRGCFAPAGRPASPSWIRFPIRETELSRAIVDARACAEADRISSTFARPSSFGDPSQPAYADLGTPAEATFRHLERHAVPRMSTVSGSCPIAWCSWVWATTFTARSRAGQLAIAARLTVASSLKGAMVSSVM